MVADQPLSIQQERSRLALIGLRGSWTSEMPLRVSSRCRGFLTHIKRAELGVIGGRKRSAGVLLRTTNDGGITLSVTHSSHPQRIMSDRNLSKPVYTQRFEPSLSNDPCLETVNPRYLC